MTPRKIINLYGFVFNSFDIICITPIMRMNATKYFHVYLPQGLILEATRKIKEGESEKDITTSLYLLKKALVDNLSTSEFRAVDEGYQYEDIRVSIHRPLLPVQVTNRTKI